MSFFSFFALTLPTLALPVARAELANVFPIGCDAGVIAGLALACSVPLHIPLALTLAVSTDTLSMVLARTKLPVVSVTREVVTFTVFSGDYFLTILSWVALALSADAVPTVVAEGGGCVVRSAACLKITCEGKVVS